MLLERGIVKMAKSGTGSVSRAINHAKRWANDPEFRKRNRARGFQYYHRKVGALQERDRVLMLLKPILQKNCVGTAANCYIIYQELKEAINGLS